MHTLARAFIFLVYVSDGRGRNTEMPFVICAGMHFQGNKWIYSTDTFDVILC